MAEIRGFPRKQKEHAKFERLLRPHLKQLYRVAYRFAGNASDAEDLVQDLMIKIYHRRDELEMVEKLRPWLVRVMYHLFIDNKRRHKRSPVHLAVDNATDDSDNGGLLEQIACEAGGPQDETARHLHAGHLLRALRQLSEDHRMVLTLHDIEGYTLEEMTRIVDAPLGTLKSRLHRARARLREILEISVED